MNAYLREEGRQRRDEFIESAKNKLDGLYVIRTNVDKGQLADSDAVRTYNGLAKVERVNRPGFAGDLNLCED